MGLNLDGVVDWARPWTFLNAMRHGRAWGTAVRARRPSPPPVSLLVLCATPPACAADAAAARAAAPLPDTCPPTCLPHPPPPPHSSPQSFNGDAKAAAAPLVVDAAGYPRLAPNQIAGSYLIRDLQASAWVVSVC